MTPSRREVGTSEPALLQPLPGLAPLVRLGGHVGLPQCGTVLHALAGCSDVRPRLPDVLGGRQLDHAAVHAQTQRVARLALAEVVGQAMTTALSTSQCFWHGEEPIRDGDYRNCGECGHIW